MKFELTVDSNTTALKATPTVLDGFPPIPTLLVGHPLPEVNADRLAVAAALAFAPYLSGQQVLPQQFSALTAQLLEAFSQPVWTHFTPLHPSNLPLPRGRRTISVSSAAHPGEDGNRTLLLVEPGSAAKSLCARTVQVSTNSGLLDAVADRCAGTPSRAQLAAAVLLAEAFDAAVLRVSPGFAEDQGIDSAVEALLNSVSLGVEIV